LAGWFSATARVTALLPACSNFQVMRGSGCQGARCRRFVKRRSPPWTRQRAEGVLIARW
jgi:hypothetical protein